MPERNPFNNLVPTKGWLRKYVEWTAGSEAPLVYHFFVGAATLGAAMKRQVWFDKGYYKVYPNMQVLLVGPTGKVRKTSAINLGIKMIQAVGGVNVISEKITPEAIVDALLPPLPTTSDKIPITPGDAVGVISAPELAVFIGRQKYNEGIIALLTTLFDSPDAWSYQTKSKGKVELTNVTVTMLGASTPDWLISAIPGDAFGGGFMSRLLFVVQEETDRCFPIPQPPSDPADLVRELQKLRGLRGEVKLEPKEAHQWYCEWYASTRKGIPEDEKMAGYHERKPDHLLRLAMALSLSEGSLTISLEALRRASHMLSFLEGEMLYTFRWLGMKPAGQTHERVLRTLRANKGRLTHAELLRKLIFHMSALEFRNAITYLVESKMVRERVSTSEHVYELIEKKEEK